jgi:diacylglycerol kinase family enzyme
MSSHIDVIATTISGSIKDWGKINRIEELFRENGEEDVEVFAVDSHRAAREKAAELVRSGNMIIISAGGSGTFNSIMEGCFDAGVDLGDVRLGFLRKGSADLIGKTLGMPDEIEAAIQVFVESIREGKAVPCDVILAQSGAAGATPRRFVGYGGAEIFGRIPYFTENRFMKYYKGILSQCFGDLGPFFVGTQLAVMSKFLKTIGRKKMLWEIEVDGQVLSHGAYQAMVIVNGDLGKDLPFARSVPLGSGDFHLFAIRDLGFLRLFSQMRKAWNASILDDAERWGFESFCIKERLVLKPDRDDLFPVNVDGSTLLCRESASFEIVSQIHLLSR